MTERETAQITEFRSSAYKMTEYHNYREQDPNINTGKKTHKKDCVNTAR